MGLWDSAATPGTLPGPTGIQMPTTPSLTKDQIMQLVAKMLKTGGQSIAGGGQPQQNLPTPGMVGQVSGQAPPIPFSTAGAPSNVAPPSPGRPQAMQVPMPQNLGQEFGTKAGAVNATVKETIGGIAEFLNNYKNKKQQDKTIEAENYFSQIMDASQTGNKALLDVLGSDPKVLKTIEEGMKYTFAKQPGGEPEPEPPASKGMKAAFQKLIGKQQGPPMPAKLPAPNTPGGIMVAGPTPQQQLAASQTNAQLSGMQQSPELRQAAAGLTLPPTEMEVLSAQERVQAGHDFAKYQVALETSRREAAKSEAAYQRQLAANQGRFDATTATARINAAAHVQGDEIMARAYMMRAALGKAAKMPTVNYLNEYSSLNRASSLMDLVMGGDKSQDTYNALVGALKGGGKSGLAVLATLPGQGSKFQAATSALQAAGGATQLQQWQTAKKGLGQAVDYYGKSLTTAYPGWSPGAKPMATGADATAPPASGGESLDDQIMKAMEEGGDEGEEGGGEE